MDTFFQNKNFLTGVHKKKRLNLPYERRWYIERWNSKGRSGYSFDWFYKIYFAAFLHRSFEVIQIWLTHQSKALIFYFGMKNFLSMIFENLWETDKVNFTSSNLMCVYTHTLNFKIWNLVCLLPTKFSKIQLKNVFMPKI